MYSNQSNLDQKTFDSRVYKKDVTNQVDRLKTLALTIPMLSIQEKEQGDCIKILDL